MHARLLLQDIALGEEQRYEAMNVTGRLKAALWQRYGNPSHPAEWDGNVYGGGKLSQRFWEYHQAIELLELTPDSVVLDVGGGSPITGAGFFTRVIAPHIKEVHVMDVNIGESEGIASNVVMHRSLAGYETLLKLLKENPQITHVACISVFEHIPPEVRCGIVKALNEGFRGKAFVATLEFHPKKRWFEYQLTTRTVSELFASFTTFYPDVISKSPFWCENAFGSVSIGRRILRRLGIQAKGKGPEVPLWYPVAFRFRRIAA
jgi:hypothetical protein